MGTPFVRSCNSIHPLLDLFPDFIDRAHAMVIYNRACFTIMLYNYEFLRPFLLLDENIFYIFNVAVSHKKFSSTCKRQNELLGGNTATGACKRPDTNFKIIIPQEVGNR